MDPTPGDPPAMSTIVLQLLVALGAIIGGAEIFVEQVLHMANSLDLERFALARPRAVRDGAAGEGDQLLLRA